MKTSAKGGPSKGDTDVFKTGHIPPRESEFGAKEIELRCKKKSEAVLNRITWGNESGRCGGHRGVVGGYKIAST